MTDNNHTEGISQEVARLFKKAHKIEPIAAECALYRATSGEEKRHALKEIISGEYWKRADADDASDNLRKILMRLHMLGDLLDITNTAESPPDEETVWIAGDTILLWVGEAEEARSLLADRLGALEARRRQQAKPDSAQLNGGAS
ncbi:MAG: hypothetical protein IIA05_05625 [Proteobacteria bacterium]|nr:hypothetical protein [Pseudomonadota bacterium]